MTTAGYSGKPVPTKLGLKPGMRVLLVDAPAGFQLVSDEITVLTRATGAQFDLALAFCPDAATVPKRFAALTEKITTAGALWIAWPRRAAPWPATSGRTTYEKSDWPPGWSTSR